MRVSIIFALSMLALSSLTGCAVEVDRETESDADTNESAGALSAYGATLVGAYSTTVSSFDFDNLVLKSDGTFFSTKQVWCVTTPCDPLREEGKFIGYKPAKGASFGGLRLVSKTTGTTTYYRVRVGKHGIELARAATTTYVKFSKEVSYCQQPKDCEGQSYPHIMCVGYAVCGEENTCGWKCGEPPKDDDKCDRSDPSKRYVGESLEQCMVIRFVCEPGEEYFSDDCGCGCAKPAETKCVRTGCSGEICADEEMMSICIWREEFACYAKADCARDKATGKCGWVETPELTSCLSRPSK